MHHSYSGLSSSMLLKKRCENENTNYGRLCKSDNNCSIYFSNYLYSSSYMGASSVAKLGHLENGGEVLAKVSNYYFGSYGGVLLGLMITVACLTTSVGLVSACSSFFHKLFPNVPYKAIAITLCVFSAIVANVGLTQLIAVSVPVLTAIYPLAIVLIFLTFFHSLFKGRAEVYQVSLIVTFIISLFDGLSALELTLK